MAVALQFRRATKEQAKLRMALIGPAGSGKTYTALNIARNLGQRIALVDTEHGSASKYADLFEFDVLELESFHPANYIEAIHAAEQAGYEVLIIDSLSHAWMGKDGALELVDRAAKRSPSGNTFAAWRDVTPLHNQLVEAMLACKCHLIVTMRSKMEYVQDKDEHGKTVIRKVGLQPVQRDGLEYEFDVVADMDISNNLIVSKARCPQLSGAVISKPGQEVADILRAWLTTGAPPAEKAKSLTPQLTPSPTAADDAAMRAELKNLMLSVGVKPGKLDVVAANRFGKSIGDMTAEEVQRAIEHIKQATAQKTQDGQTEQATASETPAESTPAQAAKWQPSQAQIKRIYAIAKAHGIEAEQVKGFIKSLFNKEHFSELTRQEYDELAAALEKGMSDADEPTLGPEIEQLPF